LHSRLSCGSLMASRLWEDIWADSRLSTIELDRVLHRAREVAIQSAERLGTLHLETLAAFHDYGVALAKVLDFPAAERYVSEACSGRRRVLGDDHADVLASLHWMAMIKRGRGQHDQAIDFFEQVASGHSSIYGSNSLMHARSMHWLAIAFLEDGRPEAAQLHLKVAIREYRASVGNTHPRTQTALRELARWSGVAVQDLDRILCMSSSCSA